MIESNKNRIASLGGIEAIISAMSAYKVVGDLQESACFALGNLASPYSMFTLCIVSALSITGRLCSSQQ
jgi:hypothetical protein